MLVSKAMLFLVMILSSPVSRMVELPQQFIFLRRGVAVIVNTGEQFASVALSLPTAVEAMALVYCLPVRPAGRHHRLWHFSGGALIGVYNSIFVSAAPT